MLALVIQKQSNSTVNEMITETELQSRLFQAENKAQELQKRAEILAEILQGLADHDFGRVASKKIAAYQAYDLICARARAVLASKS
jgi:hypothetical protein